MYIYIYIYIYIYRVCVYIYIYRYGCFQRDVKRCRSPFKKSGTDAYPKPQSLTPP